MQKILLFYYCINPQSILHYIKICLFVHYFILYYAKSGQIAQSIVPEETNITMYLNIIPV